VPAWSRWQPEKNSPAQPLALTPRCRTARAAAPVIKILLTFMLAPLIAACPHLQDQRMR